MVVGLRRQLQEGMSSMGRPRKNATKPQEVVADTQEPPVVGDTPPDGEHKEGLMLVFIPIEKGRPADGQEVLVDDGAQVTPAVYFRDRWGYRDSFLKSLFGHEKVFRVDAQSWCEIPQREPRQA